MGRDAKSRLFVKIKFINTGTESVVRYDIAMAGKVSDILYGVDFEKIYQSYYYGPYKIIEILGRTESSDKLAKIRFLNTGFEMNVVLDQAVRGEVMDYTIGYADRKFISPEYPEHDQYLNHILARKWKSMMERCYKPSTSSYKNYGALGVKVCDQWQTLEGFLGTINTVQFYDKFYRAPHCYVLDKDLKQFNIPKNQRVYSPETCIFLSYIDNDNLAIKEKHQPGEYYGIREKDGKYTVIFSVYGKRVIFGTYSDLIAAINEYHYYYFLFATWEIVPLVNDGVPFMTHLQAQKYLISK